MSGFLTSYLDVGAVPCELQELQDSAFDSNFELDFDAAAQWGVDFNELAGQSIAADSIAQMRPVSLTVTIVALDAGIPSATLASDTLSNILVQPNALNRAPISDREAYTIDVRALLSSLEVYAMLNPTECSPLVHQVFGSGDTPACPYTVATCSTLLQNHPQYGPRPDYITLGSLATLREAGAHDHVQPLPILSIDMSIPDHRFLRDYLTIHHSSTLRHFLIILAREQQVSAPRPIDRMANSHILPTPSLDPLLDTPQPGPTLDPAAAQFSPLQDLVPSMRSCLAMDRILRHEADASGNGQRTLSIRETTAVLARYSWTHSTFSTKVRLLRQATECAKMRWIGNMPTSELDIPAPDWRLYIRWRAVCYLFGDSGPIYTAIPSYPPATSNPAPWIVEANRLSANLLKGVVASLRQIKNTPGGRLQ